MVVIERQQTTRYSTDEAIMTGFVQLRPAGRLVVGLFLGIALWFSSPNHSGNVAAQQDLPPLSYTIGQAERGQTAYLENCAACHGENMDDGEFAIPLKGVNFRQQWRVRSLEQLFTVTSVTMPQARPGRLGDETYADILAYILQENGTDAGSSELPSDPEALLALAPPNWRAAPGGGVA